MHALFNLWFRHEILSLPGVRLTARELEKFLKKRKLTMEELSFVAKSEGAGESGYPRKKAKLKMGYPKFKMRDLKLSKAEEIARRKLQSQTRLKEKMAEWGEFKSISEYLASLDNSQNSSCSDLSRWTSDPDPDSDCDLSEETSQTICTELLAECLDRACEGDISLNSSSSSLEEEDSSTAAKDVRILCLERSIEEVKQRLTGMMHKESQDSSHKQQPIGKLVITPERLKNNCGISQTTKNSPKLKIKLPRETSESPDSIKLTIKTPKAVANKVVVAKLKKKKKEKSEENKNSEDSPSQLAQVEKVAVNGKLPKKYSIFKTRNDSREQSPSLVKFTDKNARKSLNIRKSLDEAPDTPPQVGELRLQEENVSSPEVPLRIVIDNESSEDGDLQDEFARTVKQESPRGKVISVFPFFFCHNKHPTFLDACGPARQLANEPSRTKKHLWHSLAYLQRRAQSREEGGGCELRHQAGLEGQGESHLDGGGVASHQCCVGPV